MKKTTIQQRTWNGSQSVNFEKIVKVEHLDYAPKKIKIRIERDSYDRQSHLDSYVWTENGWKHVASLNIKESNSDAIFYQTKMNQDTEDSRRATLWMVEDAKNLMEITTTVIF